MMMTNPEPRIYNADEPSLKCYEKTDDIFDVYNSDGRFRIESCFAGDAFQALK